MTVAALAGGGLLKTDPPFRDLFNMVKGGVQFALVSSMCVISEYQTDDRTANGDGRTNDGKNEDWRLDR